MGNNECYYGLQCSNNLFDFQFCIEFTLYHLLSSNYGLCSKIFPPNLTIYSVHSMIYTLPTRHYLLLPALYALRCTISDPLSSTILSLHSTIYAQRWLTLWTLQANLYTLRSTMYDVRPFNLYHLISALYDLHSTMYDLRPFKLYHLISTLYDLRAMMIYPLNSTINPHNLSCTLCYLPFKLYP